MSLVEISPTLEMAVEVSAATAAKERELERLLRAAAPVLVAFSGGVDSAYLAYAARRALAEPIGAGRPALLALIADSASLPRSALAAAVAFAERHDVPWSAIPTAELDNAAYRANDRERCYHCKTELFACMERELVRHPEFRTLAYGLNADDRLEWRPGHRAAAEHGVRAPLLEAGLSKREIRALARRAGLEVWDRPAAPCLSSRIAYGIEVSPEILARIEAGEEALAGLGFREFRARYHGAIVRVEVAAAELPRALDAAMAAQIVAIFKRLGFTYVTLDLEGYRSGALHEAP